MGHVCLWVLNQRTVKSLHSGDPDVMSYSLFDPLHTHLASWVKAIKALLVKSMGHLPHDIHLGSHLGVPNSHIYIFLASSLVES
jgi:hypothetical protein